MIYIYSIKTSCHFLHAGGDIIYNITLWTLALQTDHLGIFLMLKFSTRISSNLNISKDFSNSTFLF